MTSKAQLIGAARTAAAAHGLDPALVCAVCHHESSGWHEFSVRYEPRFYSRYIEKMIGLSPTEKAMRSTSFGLMQVMGQVAREAGFDGEFLTELLDAPIGLDYGCRKLANSMSRSGGDVRAALLLYNGGGNPNYPDLVLQHLDEYK